MRRGFRKYPTESMAFIQIIGEGESSMLRIVPTGLLTAIALGLTTVVNGQVPAVQKGEATAGGAQGARAAAIPGANDVVATVTINNHTDKITKGEVVGLLSRYPAPPTEDREAAYQVAVDTLIN